MNNTVSLKYLNDYSFTELENAVKDSFLKLNIQKLFKPKMKVMLKVCLPYNISPDSAETTHPALVQAIISVLSGMGVACLVADSPIKNFNQQKMDSLYITTGMLGVANSTKGELNYNYNVVKVSTPNGKKTKSLTLIDAINDVDLIINVAKLKVDERFGYKGAAHNLFGLIPGEVKEQVLNRLTTLADYNNYLLDVYQALKKKIVLNVVDAIVAIEAGQSQRMLSCLGIAENPFSLDAAMLNIINVPIENSIVKQASERNLVELANPYKLVDEDIKSFKIDDFAVYEFSATNKLHKNSAERKRYFKHNQQRTVINSDVCKGCSVCSKICPTGAIVMKYDKNNELYASIDYQKCIFCNKCYAACPYKVVKLKTPNGYKKLEKKLSARQDEKE